MKLCDQYLSCLRRCFCFSGRKWAFLQNKRLRKSEYQKIAALVQVQLASFWFGTWISRHRVYINSSLVKALYLCVQLYAIVDESPVLHNVGHWHHS